MEREIGEIFRHDNEYYQCLKAEKGCRGCSFKKTSCINYKDVIGECQSPSRAYRDNVIFEKLEKVGEPIYIDGVPRQRVMAHCVKCEKSVNKQTN